MLKIVLDANVFASALLNPHGKPADILDLVFDNRVRLIATLSILEELRRVLSYPKLVNRHGLSEGEVEEFVYDLLLTAVAVVDEGDPVEAIAKDPSDNKYLSCGAEARADFIVSGDRHLLELGSYKGIRIVTPAMFLELME